MKHVLPLFITIIIPYLMNAQTNGSITGEYYLRGVMETASGFNLYTDSSFEFFFSYGALDRYGSGTWSIKNDKIVFNSKPAPGSDFRLIESSSDENNFITLKFPGISTQFTSYFYCIISSGNENKVFNADSHGVIIIPERSVDSIHLVFEFCPEKLSSFRIDASKHNVYSFQPEKWMMEYFFKDFELLIKDDHLEGKHPLLTKETCIFEKN